MSANESLLIVRNLRTNFYTYAGVVRALDGVNFDVRKGETLGLVGETGCGKSVTALSIMRLVPDPPGRIDDGEIIIQGEDLLKISEKQMQSIRGNLIAMAFQDPTTFLNPVMTIGEQVAETLLAHQDLRKDLLAENIRKLTELAKAASGKDAEILKERIRSFEKLSPEKLRSSRRQLKRIAIQKSIELLQTVKMPDSENVVRQYPHELSGGMKQRVIIAMGIACRPRLLIADEPTTALDVTIQAQILDLLGELKREIGLSILLITHDLGVVAETCDRVAVMYAGNIVEVASTEDLFERPSHPYAQALLRAVPKATERRDELEVIRGTVPNLINPPEGCRFYPRCPYAMDVCMREKPELEEVEPDHFVACCLNMLSIC